jgi:cyclophilin family peptidyl-prolyl cis-trans isomerase
MLREVRFFVLLTALSWASSVNATNIVMCTDVGRVVIELFDEDAPQHVENFLNYTDRGFYGGTVFHRAIKGFVVQGGGFNRELKKKQPVGTVPNESRNGRRNDRGTIAAARTSDPDSASSQFFVNLADNYRLDATRRTPGYTVFGKVVEGLYLIDEIAELPTGANGEFSSDVPDPLISISSVTRLNEEQFSDALYTERNELIRTQINNALTTNDQAAAFRWINQYRSACLPMDPSLLIVESQAAIAIDNEVAALASLEEYLRTAEDTHLGYADALETYLTLAPEETQYNQAIMPGVAQIAGHCVPPEILATPDGQVATMNEMGAEQVKIRSYMAAANEYLACLAQVIDDSDLSQDEEILVSSMYDQVVDTMENLAVQFNEQIKIIRARQ